jgi:hypothetical protein
MQTYQNSNPQVSSLIIKATIDTGYPYLSVGIQCSLLLLLFSLKLNHVKSEYDIISHTSSTIDTPIATTHYDFGMICQTLSG